jgi:hypothetical protein
VGIFFVALIMFGSFFTMNLVLAVLEGSVSQGKTSDALAAEQQARKSAAIVVQHTIFKGRKRVTMDSTRSAVKAADTAAAAGGGGASKMRRQGAVRRLSIRLIDMAESAAVAGDAIGGGDIDDINDSDDSFPLNNSHNDSSSSAMNSKGVRKQHVSPVAVRPRRQTVDVCSRATSTSSMHSSSSSSSAAATVGAGVTATAAGMAGKATAAVAVANGYCCEDQQHSKQQHQHVQQQQQQQQQWTAKTLVAAVAQLWAPSSRFWITANGFRARVNVMVHSPWFTNCVAALIIANTAVLASDRHPISQSTSFALEGLNFSFSLVFMLEMVLKLIALGPRAYVADRFNFFDGIVVNATETENCVLMFISQCAKYQVLH